MVNLQSGHVPVKPGRPDRGAPAPKRSFEPDRLEGRDRRAFEAEVLATPGLKGSRLHLARVLLDGFCWGKPGCFPGDERLALKLGVGRATISRALRDLVELGVIRIAKVRGRRWIVFVGHPHAAAFLAGLGVDEEPVDHPAGPAHHPVGSAHHPVTAAPQIDARSVDVKPESEARHEAAPAREGEPEGSPSGPNEPTTGEPPRPRPTPTPRPIGMTSRRLAMVPDLAGAPADDPVIAAELARRACAREAAAAVPSRDEVLAAVLGAAAGDAPGVDPAPEGRQADADGRDAAHAVDPEVATIEALARLGPGATRAEVMVATARLTALFDDRKSTAFYRGVVNRVVRGELSASILGTAVRAARGPDVIRPGAAFTAAVGRCEAVAARRAASEGR